MTEIQHSFMGRRGSRNVIRFFLRFFTVTIEDNIAQKDFHR